jgi:signal transduction histidine kinase
VIAVTARFASPLRGPVQPLALDWLLALALAAVGAYTAIAQGGSGSRAGLLALACGATLPLGFRRRLPLPVLVVVVVATGTAAVVYGSYWPLGVMVALYSVAAERERRVVLVCCGGALVALAIPIAVASDWRPLTLLRLVPLAAAWILGDSVRTRRAYLRAVEERAAQLEREHEANARRAAAEEQARIAREVHDVVAHNLSVIVVQATAADAVFDSEPTDARRAVRAIGSTARRALDDLRRVLEVIRADERRSADLSPLPGLSGIDDLLEQVRTAGLDVDLEIAGEAHELPPALELSAYRIVQEALTNTLRHARAQHAHVLLRFEADELGVEVSDDGAARPVANGGHGLIGMRERAAALGGDVEAGPAPEGGFRVAARLPTGATVR